MRRLGKICKEKIYSAASGNPALIHHELLELEISALSDGLAMQFIRYYHDDIDVTLEQIIAFGKMWSKDMILRRTNQIK